jgi:membrane protein DedA with SNARE-associated domain
MTWRRYVLWNTAGGVIWVLSNVMLGYFVGRTAGLFHGALILGGIWAAGVIVGGLWIIFLRRRAQRP